MATIHLVLIHGTFAQNTPWVKKGSRFRQTLEALQSQKRKIVFDEFMWSGKNKLSDRICAAQALAEEILSHKIIDSDDRIFLVGHSHGGSIISLLLKEYPEIRDCVSGCIFLSTPFYALRVDPSAQRFVTIAAANLVIFVIPLFLAFLCAFFRTSGLYKSLEEMFGHVATWATFAVPMVSLAAMPVVFYYILKQKYFNGLRLRAVTNRRKGINRAESARMPSGNYLFIRASGDEAALFLSVFLFINAVLRKLSASVSIYSTFYERFFVRKRNFFFRSLVFIISLSLFMLIMFLHMFAGPYGLGVIDFPERNFTYFVWRSMTYVLEIPFDRMTAWMEPDRANSLPMLVESTLSMLVVALDLAILSNVVGFLLMFIGYMLGVVGLWFSGWMSFGQAMYMEIAIEPVPYGYHQLVHVKRGESASSTNLSHSAPYEDPQALNVIVDWFKEQLDV